MAPKPVKVNGLTFLGEIASFSETVDSFSETFVSLPPEQAAILITGAIEALQTGSTDESFQLENLTVIRKQLSSERNPPIDQAVQCGGVPILVEFLKKDEAPLLQFEAAWALTNIASGTSEQCETVAEQGAMPEFIRLLMSPHLNVRDQCIWALGNIAGDCTRLRDTLLNLSIADTLIELFKDPEITITIRRNLTWTVSNLCRGKPSPKLSQVSPFLQILSDLVLNYADVEILADACWALSYISDGDDDAIDSVLNSGPGLVSKLVDLLDSVPAVTTPTLRTLGNFATGDDLQTESVLKAGILDKFPKLLNGTNTTQVKEACWSISNITAGNQSQIEQVLQAGLFEPLLAIIKNNQTKATIRKEATWAIANAAQGGSLGQLSKLVSLGAVEALGCNLGENQTTPILSVTLEGLKCFARQDLDASFIFDELLGKLEMLQDHSSENIYAQSKEILERIMDDEWETDEDDDQETNNDAPFDFGSDPLPSYTEAANELHLDESLIPPLNNPTMTIASATAVSTQSSEKENGQKMIYKLPSLPFGSADLDAESQKKERGLVNHSGRRAIVLSPMSISMLLIGNIILLALVFYSGFNFGFDSRYDE